MYFSGSMGEPLEVNRNETKEIKINITEDTEMCNEDRIKHIKHTYQWLIYDGQLILQLTTGNLPILSILILLCLRFTF